MKTAFALGISGLFVVAAVVATMTVSAVSKPNRVSISYEQPQDSSHNRVYTLLKQHKALEKLQVFLSPFKLPRRVKLSVKSCNGEVEAHFDEDVITICYEYVNNLWNNIPSQTTEAGIAPMDTVMGPFYDTALHEFGHALFEMHKLPVFGRMEDAADQVATYIYLQLGTTEARRLVMATAYAYVIESRAEDAPATPNEFAEDFSEEHGTPIQRAYNVLCMAYGADTIYFSDFISKGYLPKDRAEVCEEEYEQVQDAFERPVGPYIEDNEVIGS